MLAELRTPVAINITIMIRSNLYEVERYVSLLEISSPLSYQVGETLGVLTIWVAYVGTALVEQNAFYGIVKNRVEGAITPKKRVVKVPLEFLALDYLGRVCLFFCVLLQIVTVGFRLCWP